MRRPLTLAWPLFTGWPLSQRHTPFLVLPAIVLLFVLYVSGVSSNPPGFYMDESCLAYNAYLISRTGHGEFGPSFPLYVQCFTDRFTTYVNPTFVYLLAMQFLLTGPSIAASRIFSAAAVFLATLLLGYLATRISGNRLVGLIVALTAMLTPWLFEVSRLVFEVVLYPLALVFFLLCLYRASRRERWTHADSVLIALGLALLTYSYTIGRFLGPVLAFGLLIFVVDKHRLADVIKTWALYTLTLVPLFLYVVRNPGMLEMRFREVTFMSAEKSLWTMLVEFAQNYYHDVSLQFLLFAGDPILRHHVGQSGMIFVATLVLAIIGGIRVLTRLRQDRWWWFVLFGLGVSVIPAALTVQRFHALRLIAFPIFLLVLTIPALAWSIERAQKMSLGDAGGRRSVRFLFLVGLLALTTVEAIRFHSHFRQFGPLRGHDFHAAYPQLLKEALTMPARPIYLKDGLWGPTYVHAYWYGATEGLDLARFVHLTDAQVAPPASLVLSSEDNCDNCQILLKRGSFLLYSVSAPEELAEFEHWKVGHGKGTGPGEFSRPRGIATDAHGHLYVADSGNARVQKFSPSGEFMAFIATPGTGASELREPNAIAVDAGGDVFIADATRNQVLRFKPDGSLTRTWPGFSGPSDMAIGPNNYLYIVDRGSSRVVVLDPETGRLSAWGEAGTGRGAVQDLIGISVSGGRVYVTDGKNDRVQVFDLDGKFIREWSVRQWDKYIWHRPDVAVDENAGRIYVSSGWTAEVLVFDMEGNVLSSLKPKAPDVFNNVSALAMSEVKGSKRLYVLSTGSDVVDTGAPALSVFELDTPRKRDGKSN